MRWSERNFLYPWYCTLWFKSKIGSTFFHRVQNCTKPVFFPFWEAKQEAQYNDCWLKETKTPSLMPLILKNPCNQQPWFIFSTLHGHLKKNWNIIFIQRCLIWGRDGQSSHLHFYSFSRVQENTSSPVRWDECLCIPHLYPWGGANLRWIYEDDFL